MFPLARTFLLYPPVYKHNIGGLGYDGDPLLPLMDGSSAQGRDAIDYAPTEDTGGQLTTPLGRWVSTV